MTTYFISDLHLEDAKPVITDLLLEFLSGMAREAEAVYILGDLFEYWIGDDVISETARRVATAIAELTAAGTACFFCGLKILPESVVIDLYGKPTLLLHGDTLCTDDVEYQAFRAQSRNPAWQAGMLALSPGERMDLARSARDASMKHTTSAAMDIMDTNEAAVRAAFIEHGVTRMIHGHTHRPATHDYVLDGGERAQRVVLSDWPVTSNLQWVGSCLRAGPEGLSSLEVQLGL
jgi:UDP-2,3-diacylglucosamine hydrolase